LRSDPQIDTTFKLAMTASKFFEDKIAPGLSRPYAETFSIAD
jgi:hypothetical protein